MSDHTTDRILFALYCFSRDTRQIDASSLARSCGVTATQAAHALLELERLGSVDVSRARLTMLGLARAVALEAGGQGGPAIDLSQTKPRMRTSFAGIAASPPSAASIHPPPSAASIHPPPSAAASARPEREHRADEPHETCDAVDPFGPRDTPANGH
ncbi:MAG TPA: hypothetical protein VGI70_16025 [Polyangiales bacterium]